MPLCVVSQTSLDATWIILFGLLAAVLVGVSFLSHRTARDYAAWGRALRILGSLCLVTAGLLLGAGLLETVFRFAVPGGYLGRPPMRVTPSDVSAEKLPDGQAYWEFGPGDGFEPDGFRGPNATRALDDVKMVVLGDSITYGVFVEREEAFVYLLYQELTARCKGLSLYDLATPGYSTLQERIALERRGVAVGPDLILLGVYSNDIAQYTVLGSSAYDVRVRDMEGIPTFKLLPLPESLNAMLLANSVFYQFVTLRGLSVMDEITDRGTGQVTASLAEMERIRLLSATHGAKLVVILFPELDQELTGPEDARVEFYYRQVRSWAQAHSLSLLDLREPLSRYPLDSIRIDSCCHYSPAGHEAVYRTILQHLLANQALPKRCLSDSTD